MAATKRNAMNIAEAREKIRTTQLVKRLENHAFGEVDMSSTQVQAAVALLKKSLPDLAAQTDKDGNTPKQRILVEIADAEPSHSHPATTQADGEGE
jgi:hypothetical protein